MSAPIITARRVLHPGRTRPDRIATAMGHAARRALVWLPEGMSLHDAVTGAFRSLAAEAGAFHLLGGRLATAVYHVATPDAASRRAVEYGAPIFIEGGAAIIRATGSYGETLSGAALLHIHGNLADRDNRAHGGHINPELCVTAPGGVRAILMLSVGFKQVADRETDFSLFFPVAAPALNG